MPLNDIGISKNAPRALTDGTQTSSWLDASGATVVIDFFAKCILDGLGYQVRAGTITTPITGDVAITDTAAEYCVDATAGYVIVPVFNQISVRAGTGTAHEMAIKSAATVSSAGTAFTLLPLKSGGTAAALTARAQTAGAVTVTAELATTTLRHWEYAQQAVFTTGQVIIPAWEPLRPPVLNGARCIYVQIAAATTGPSYYAHMDVLQFTSAQIGQ
jgi:hypothetical protein